MTDRPLVSLLMPVHNRAHLLERVLEQLALTTTYPNVELVAVDDGSTDRSVEILRRWVQSERAPRMKLIESENRGAINALNTALNASSGEFCVQLDDDVTIETPGWIERMLELMGIDESVGVVTPKVVFDSGELQTCGVHVIGPAGWHERGVQPAEPIGRRLWLNRVKGRVHESQGGPIEHTVAEIDSGIGCCMMYRRRDALAAGGYDMAYSPVWFDDVDLCLGIRVLGRKAFYLPDIRVTHHFTGRRAPEGAVARFRPRRLARAIVRRTGGRLPFRFRAPIERRFDIDLEMHFTKEQCARLRHHHAYWRQKWGFDARNPDMVEVRRRWGDTEICWATDPARRAAGERIVRAYEEAHRPHPAGQA